MIPERENRDQKHAGPPPVSVVIPCYNHGPYLIEAIASVEECPRELYELIIVNDGSTDSHTINLIIDLEQQGYHVINQPNMGLGFARNTGISRARGRYVLPLDADNMIVAEYLTSAIPILDTNPSIAVVYGRPKFFGSSAAAERFSVLPFDLPLLMLRNYIDACAVIRKTAWEECGGYDSQMPSMGLEDWDLWLSLAERGWQFHFEDKFLYRYRLREDSMIAQATKGMKESNMQYIYGKHHRLLWELMSNLYSEVSDRRTLVPYFLRRLKRRIQSHALRG